MASASRHSASQIELPCGNAMPSEMWLRQFRRQLLAWFKRNARDLPWRRTRDPYHVWISEVMLQQTQVATVVPYFERFSAAFPTIKDLAGASEEQVLRLWEGLGYYRRARQLHRAAQVIATEYGGVFPGDPERVRRLPGIGRYTAGAILSIAFDQPEPIVEANTLRLYSRLLAYPDNLQAKAGQHLLWQFATRLLPRRDAGALNQALMDLGAMVCTPRSPSCAHCPVATLCPTRRDGLQETIPRPRVKPAIEAVRQAAVVVRYRDKLLLRRQKDGERWAGLWDFPRFELLPAPTLDEQLAAGVLAQTGVRIGAAERLTVLKHGVTRFRITLECFETDCLGKPGKPNLPDMQWVTPAELADYPLSVTGRRLARLLQA